MPIPRQLCNTVNYRNLFVCLNSPPSQKNKTPKSVFIMFPSSVHADKRGCFFCHQPQDHQKRSASMSKNNLYLGVSDFSLLPHKSSEFFHFWHKCYLIYTQIPHIGEHDHCENLTTVLWLPPKYAILHDFICNAQISSFKQQPSL